jgi:glutamate--cysteine ligase
MEQYFDAGGPAGRTMMRSTAAVQINLDLGEGAELDRRWRGAHDLAPLLAASFANSPLGPNGPTGTHSSRLAVWDAIDRGRTAPVGGNGAGPRQAWAHYVLSAQVMLVQADTQHHEAVLTPLTFAEWIEHGHALGWPTGDDLAYHLTTLFPPVRPRGWLELRMIDAVPAPWWRVAAAVTAILVQHPALAPLIDDIGRATRGLWGCAVRDGLGNAALRDAAVTCFEAALHVLPETGIDQHTLTATEAYLERYVRRGRSPADDRLDDWARGGPGLPAPDNQASSPS